MRAELGLTGELDTAADTDPAATEAVGDEEADAPTDPSAGDWEVLNA